MDSFNSFVTMKQFVILFSIFLISCNQNEKAQNNSMRKSDKTNNAAELIDNDFLKYVDSSKIDTLKVQLTKSFDIYSEDNFKIAHIDAEELAEFSFDFFLPSINRILAKRDLKISAHKLNDNEKSFDALINGDTVQLNTQKDFDNNTSWDVAPRKFFQKVNDLLKAKNVDEQFYLLYSGNDLHAMLLTDKQFSIIADHYKDKPKEIPYRP
jgi:hypothetical protein